MINQMVSVNVWSVFNGQTNFLFKFLLLLFEKYPDFLLVNQLINAALVICLVTDYRTFLKKQINK